MKTFDELQQIAGHRTIDISIDELKEHLTPKIKVIDRSDKDNKGIRIIKRNDTRMNLNGEEK